MIRKLTVAFIAILLVSLFIASPALAAKTYYAERFDVQIDLQEDGSAIVTETVEFRFEGGDFTYAFREISATETDGVTFLEASMDGVPMPQGTGAGQVEVEAGDALKVTWHFLPTSDAARVLVVRYRAAGVVRTGDADMLIWRAVPEEHEYSIRRSTITLTYPARATLLETPTLSRDFESASTEDRIILIASGISPDEDLIFTAKFSPNSLTQSAPQWQLRQAQSAAATARALPFGLGSFISTLVLGLVGLFSYARSNARESNINPVVTTANPPGDLSPAIVGKLTKQQHTVMGAIFDLSQRGVLEVREGKGFWGTKNYVLVRTDLSSLLRPFEQALLEAVFKRGESQVSMSEVPSRLAMKNQPFDDSLEQELLQRGWLDPERKTRKTWLVAAGILMMFLGIIIGFVSTAIGGMIASQNPAWIPALAVMLGACAGLFILSLPVLIYGASFSVLTPSGEEQASRWKGFAEYIKQVSKGREPAIRPDYFEKYLAYAAVFGFGAGWAKYFERLGGVPLPIWFHAAAGSSADFGGMIAVMSASDSAGASAGADGGGGGASGGGSSGAG